MFCLSSLNNESLFHKAYRNGRTLLALKVGLCGLRVSGTRVAFASGYSRAFHCTSIASHGMEGCMSDVSGSDTALCPLHSVQCLIGTNPPQSKFMQQNPFNQ